MSPLGRVALGRSLCARRVPPAGHRRGDRADPPPPSCRRAAGRPAWRLWRGPAHMQEADMNACSGKPVRKADAQWVPRGSTDRRRRVM